MAIFVKYEIWPNFFAQIQNKKIPIYIISAVFKKNHWFFKWYGAFGKDLLEKVDGIFVQDKTSLELMKANGLNNGNLSGDVRVDRVIQIKQTIEPIERVESFLNGARAIVFGSVYQSDADVMRKVMGVLPDRMKIIVAPHNINPAMLDFLKQIFHSHSLWSDTVDQTSSVLIMDNVGYLNKVYQYGSSAYIGGGFEKSIHNILEPSVFNIPVAFGPKHHPFPEAQSLIQAGLALSSGNTQKIADYLIKSLMLKGDDAFRTKSIQWFEENSGATELIYKRIFSNI